MARVRAVPDLVAAGKKQDAIAARWALVNDLILNFSAATDSRTKAQVASTINAILKEIPGELEKAESEKPVDRVDELLKRRQSRGKSA